MKGFTKHYLIFVLGITFGAFCCLIYSLLNSFWAYLIISGIIGISIIYFLWKDEEKEMGE